jgi:GNAT superfamily N-acetyltransferase
MPSSFPRLANHPDGAGAEQYLASVSSQSEREYPESPRYAYIVAELDGDIRGFSALRDVSHAFHLFVDRQDQRRGIAHRLWREAKNHALEAAAPTQFTASSSLSAVATDRAFAFRCLGRGRGRGGAAVVTVGPREWSVVT